MAFPIFPPVDPNSTDPYLYTIFVAHGVLAPDADTTIEINLSAFPRLPDESPDPAAIAAFLDQFRTGWDGLEPNVRLVRYAIESYPLEIDANVIALPCEERSELRGWENVYKFLGYESRWVPIVAEE